MSRSQDPPVIVEKLEFDPEYDLNATISGTKAPVIVGPGAWWSTRTPEGTATASIAKTANGEVTVKCWGAGSQWMQLQVPKLLGADDPVTEFRPTGLVGELWKHSKFKLGRTDLIWDAAIGAILSQKVQVTKAIISRKKLARFHGELAPGPRRAWVLPSPQQVAQMSYANLHGIGIERKRADTLIRCAKEMPRLVSDQSKSVDKVVARLESVRGIGPWTSQLIAAVCLGYSDAVPVGDYHIPNTVAWQLAKEDRATDTRMLELLEVYKPDRWRVIRLCKATGTAPKYGARLSLRGSGIDEGY